MSNATLAIWRCKRTAALWLTTIIVLTIVLQKVAVAGDPCQRRAYDHRSARVQVVNIRVTAAGIVGKVKYTTTGSGSEMAVDVAVWVNYYRDARGGIIGQQCIVVGDMKPGEEREFAATSIPEAARAGSFDTAVAATEWR